MQASGTILIQLKLISLSRHKRVALCCSFAAGFAGSVDSPVKHQPLSSGKTAYSECQCYYVMLSAGAQGHLPLNEATRNCIALTGPAISDAVWQTFPEQLSHCTTGWTRLQDMDWGVEFHN